MLYGILRTIIKIFSRYDELTEFHGFYIGHIYFYTERFGYPLNKEYVCIIDEHKDRVIYAKSKPF